MLSPRSGPDSVATAMLAEASIQPDVIRAKLEAILKPGTHPNLDLDASYTLRAKKTLELAMYSVRELGHSHVGTEHLLLGLLRERNGIAGQVLIDAGSTEDVAMQALVKLVGLEVDSTAKEWASTSSSTAGHATRVSIVVEHADGTSQRVECESNRQAILYLLRS